MWSWLTGQSDKKDEKPITQPLKLGQATKPRKPQWVSDDNGSWKRNEKSSTSTLLNILEPVVELITTEVVVGELTKAIMPPRKPTDEAPTHSVSKTDARLVDDSTLPNDSPVDPTPSLPANPGLDALDNYQEQLATTGKGLQEALARWKLLKEEIIGTDLELKRYASDVKTDEQAHHQGVLSGIANFFKHLFEKIKEGVVPADVELHGLLETTHKDVQVLCKHLDDSSRLLSAPETPVEQQRQLSIDMCDTSINIINDLINLINNIQYELQYCLKAEKITENAAKKLILLAILIVTKIPLPDIELSFNDSYRNFLYNEIESEKKKIDLFESDVIRALNAAMKEIKEKELEWVVAKKKESETETEKLSDCRALVVFKPISFVPVSTPTEPAVQHALTNNM